MELDKFRQGGKDGFEVGQEAFVGLEGAGMAGGFRVLGVGRGGLLVGDG